MLPSCDRPFLIFRRTRLNRYTLPALLGTMEKEGLSDSFSVFLAKTVEEMLPTGGSGEGLFCFSFMTPHLEQVKEELKKLKNSLAGRVLFLAGGPHATGDPEGTRGLGFDFVFRGEAEETFPHFLRQYLAGRIPSAPIIQGGEPVSLEAYPPFSIRHRLFPPLEITRGCLYACSFCQTPRIFGRSLRHRRPESVGDFIRRILPRGYLQTFFRSPNAFAYGVRSPQNFDPGAIEALFRACRESGVQGIHFGCYPSEVRPDWVNPEVLGVVKKSCRNKTIVLGARSAMMSHTGRGYWLYETPRSPVTKFLRYARY